MPMLYFPVKCFLDFSGSTENAQIHVWLNFRGQFAGWLRGGAVVAVVPTAGFVA